MSSLWTFCSSWLRAIAETHIWLSDLGPSISCSQHTPLSPNQQTTVFRQTELTSAGAPLRRWQQNLFGKRSRRSAEGVTVSCTVCNNNRRMWVRALVCVCVCVHLCKYVCVCGYVRGTREICTQNYKWLKISYIITTCFVNVTLICTVQYYDIV